MRTVPLAPVGVMPTICPADGALVSYRAGDDLHLEHVGRDGVVTALATFPVVPPGGGDSSFPKLEAWNARHWLGYRTILADGANVAGLRDVTNGVLGPERLFGVVIGNDPVAFSADGWFGWQRGDGGGVDGVRLDALDATPVRLSTRYAPTGLAFLADGGAPVFNDDNRGSVPGMLDPSRAGAVIVGKGVTGGLAVRVGALAGVLLDGEITDDPQAADLGDGLFAAVMWGDSVRAVLFTAADLASAPIIPAVGRACLVGWYHFGDLPENAPGNCDLQVDGEMLVRERATGRPLAAYAAGSPDGDVAALDAAIIARRAAHPDLPVLAYWTAAAQRVRVPIGAEIIGVEGYMHVTETLADFEQRLWTAVSVCPYALIVGQDYTSNTDNTTDVADLVAVYARIMARARNVVGLIVFSSGTRATGYDAHPETQAAYAQVAASVTGLPVLPAPRFAPAPDPVPQPAPRPVPQPRPAPLPVPVPPVPPPSSPFGVIGPYEVPMDTQTVGLIGPGGKYASVNKATKLLTFDKTEVGLDEQFELSKPDDRFQIVNIGTGLLVGIDVTQYGSNDLRRLFTLHNPATQPRGNYESFFVGKTPNGLILAFIEYIAQGAIVGSFASPALTVVAQ